MYDDIKHRFLTDTDETGRFIVKSFKTGKTYFVEPISSGHCSVWGDVDPATKKLTGNYGEKYTGSVSEKESLINESNGFVNIVRLDPGDSPLSYIYEKDKQYERQMR